MLRLIINTPRIKRIRFFVVFVDIAMIMIMYDNVPRQKLFLVMKGLGCGAVMVAAVMAMYHTTGSA